MVRVGFLVDDLFEEAQFRVPYHAVTLAGHEAQVVGLHADREVHSVGGQFAVHVERAITDVGLYELDALVIPGGYSPDRLRISPDVVGLVRHMMGAHKPVAAICHGASLLIDAQALHGRVLTSASAIKADIANAGARWVDKEVVVDGNLVTSRGHDDLAAFCLAFTRMIEMPISEMPPERAANSKRH